MAKILIGKKVYDEAYALNKEYDEAYGIPLSLSPEEKKKDDEQMEKLLKDQERRIIVARAKHAAKDGKIIPIIRNRKSNAKADDWIMKLHNTEGIM